MPKLLIVAALIGGAALLASCVALRERKPPLIVHVERHDDGCRMIVEGEQVSMDRLLNIASSATRRRGIIIFAGDTPYKCIGGAVFTLQRAGLTSVDAVSSTAN